MNDSTCPRPCLMKLDLQSSTNKLAFLKDNWPSFGQIESIDRLSETELRCTLCLLDVVLAALAKDECFCPNREIIRLVLTRTYVQNRCELCETEEIRSKLMKGFFLYMGKEERIEQEERNPEKRDFFLLWCHTAHAIESKRETRIDGICPKIKGA
ncbi:hypothetical protein KQP56_14715 [Bacteroides thetaiotaomicron]|uniref:hypothetical protein n=1 Tax=Bacteroides thetaiotaomicron TaxID=818 RepID=UPI0022224968|nr:hypothetical protein [Bacteroides thetaiotaomicron]UYU93889.1 hypothetical protein KQP56_14715 [Bacteroides thetaiotaomicron]